MLQRARLLQQEKFKLNDEIKNLRNAEGDKSESAALKQKISELESELANLRKTVAESSVELTRLKAQNSMAQNKSNRLQKELDLLRANKSMANTLSANAAPFQPSTSTNTAASAVSSPKLNNVQPTKLKPVASPTPAKAELQVPTSNIASASDLSSPAVPIRAESLGSPLVSAMTSPAASAMQSEQVNTSTSADTPSSEPVNTDKNEDNAAVSTPITAEPASASTPTVVEEVDNELSMDADNVTNDQVSEDLVDESNEDPQITESNNSAENKDEPVEEAPVDVEVHEVPTAEKPGTSPIDESSEIVENTSTNEENTQTEKSAESPIVAADDIEEGEIGENTTVKHTEITDEIQEKIAEEPTVGLKRKDRLEDSEDNDTPTPGSPSKKLHTFTDETTEE